jgi:branched-chain amino acid transport system permease protein
MKKGAWVLLAVALAGFPWIAGEYYINLASQILIAAVFAASLNLLVGYGGLPSLGSGSRRTSRRGCR